MTIENLINAVPPPVDPVGAFSGPWEPIEAELGVHLPPDDKEFVRLYGGGYFLEFLGVDVPRARNPNVRLEPQVPRTCKALREAWDIPHPIWPEPGGLLPFGGTDNGDYLLWVAEGDPSGWRVAVLEDDSFGEFEVFDLDMTDFLAGLATGALRPEGLPADLFDCDQPCIPDPEPRQHIVRITWRFGSDGTGPSGGSDCRMFVD